MSTIARLWRAGVLAAWDLPDGRLPERCFYYASDWAKFFGGLDRTPGGRFGQRRRLAARDQVAGLVNEFVAGRSRAWVEKAGMQPPFNIMRPPAAKVWEMRTGDTRTFGWFADLDSFVAISGAMTADLKTDQKLYGLARDRVHEWRLQRGVPAAEIANERNWADLVSDPDPAG